MDPNLKNYVHILLFPHESKEGKNENRQINEETIGIIHVEKWAPSYEHKNKPDPDALRMKSLQVLGNV